MDHQQKLGASRAGDVVLVLSDRHDAAALGLAADRGIVARHIADHADGDALLAPLREHHAELLVLAGYLRLLPLAVVRAFAGRIVNVHPALLPSFGGKGMFGRRLHEAVLASGARVSGATVHFVDEEYDRGAIIAQWPVPVLTGDDADTLASRVLTVEHLLYPLAVEAVAGGRIRLGADGRATGGFAALPRDSSFTLVSSSSDALGSQMAAALA